MIVSNHLKEHLKGPKALYVGSRDKDFNCDVLRAIGVMVTGHDTVKYYLAESTANKMLDNLRSNKLVNLSVTNIFTSESYQLKGRMLQIKPVTGAEEHLIKEYIQQFDEAIAMAGYKPGLVAAHTPLHPAVSIEFVVDEVFDQTPKMG